MGKPLPISILLKLTPKESIRLESLIVKTLELGEDLKFKKSTLDSIEKLNIYKNFLRNKYR